MKTPIKITASKVLALGGLCALFVSAGSTAFADGYHYDGGDGGDQGQYQQSQYGRNQFRQHQYRSYGRQRYGRYQRSDSNGWQGGGSDDE